MQKKSYYDDKVRNNLAIKNKMGDLATLTKLIVHLDANKCSLTTC